MKQHISELIEKSLHKLGSLKNLELNDGIPVELERTRDNQHGEFASNIAMRLARRAGMKPSELAKEITGCLPESEFIERVEIAGPGFINFFLRPNAYSQSVKEILEAGESYGRADIASGKKVLVEFVSANPTGPLHIGHGRGAAYGDAVSNMLQATGHEVVREYYVNDSGRQMDILAVSVWLRYLQHCGHDYPFPNKAYQADYVRDIAGTLFHDKDTSYEVSLEDLFTAEWLEQDDETRLDRLIEYARQKLGDERYTVLFNAGLDAILKDIRADLEEFGVRYDNWFSEQSLAGNGAIDTCLEKLNSSGDIYEKGGARWFSSSKYGDEKDRVVERENGLKTYFASDIAYHNNKFERGFDTIIDIWGSDHHGYIDRVKGALTALGHEKENMEVLLVQFATLYRGGQKVQMSTRSGQYVTLRELLREVGKDAARFFYVTRKSDQHLDFDLDLAKSESNENPVYYIQYAHARICSVIQQMHERGYEYDRQSAMENLDRLTEDHEIALLKNLSRFPEIVHSAANKYEPHQIGFYLRDLANDFHSYYNSHQFLIKEDILRQARISLILATRQVIQNGLRLLGVSAPEKM